MHLYPYTSLFLTASAVIVPLQPRANTNDPCAVDPSGVGDLGPTVDGAAGIGAEFESPAFYFTNPECSPEDTFAAKGKIVNGRTGDQWILSADTGGNEGKLNAEYILNGEKIKVGSGDGAKSGREVANDLIGWKPWQGDDKAKEINIQDNKCNPWKVTAPSAKSAPEKLPWSPQITTAMPLEALYSLMDELLRDPDELNILNGILGAKNLVLVTKDFFQSKPQGIDGSKLSDDILAFCTLVLSYAKAASIGLKPNQSPKLYINYMPRTEFNTLFKQVEAKLPGDKLFDVFNVLACYNNKGGTVELDETYCEGSLDKPEPIGTKFSDLTYKNDEASVNIKDWITSVGKKEGDKDKLSVFDESIDKSIGGFGTSLEKTYKTDRSVPMFEFRDLLDKQTQEIEKFMGDVDTAIQDLHEKFANPPTKRKRDDACAPQPAPSATSAAPPQDTVKPADPPSQPSCVPNPTKPVKDAHENEQKKVTKFFCDKYAKNTNAQAPVSVVQTVMAGTKFEVRGVIDIAFDYPAKEGNQDDVYDITIKSVDKCTPAHGNNLAAPVPGSTCEDILNKAWKNCNNQGRGGDITADCLVYSIHTKF